nr:uncharacterized protein LOC113826968 [Penaeus vannamei]
MQIEAVTTELADCYNNAEKLTEIHILSSNLEALLQELNDIIKALENLQGSRRRFLMSSSLLSLLNSVNLRKGVVCAEADNLPAVLEDLNIALSSFGENPTDEDLADLVSCAAHQTLTVFSQVARGKKDLSASDRAESERLLQQLTGHRMAGIAAVVAQNQSYNEAKRSALELRLSELTSRQQEIKGALREVHEGSLGA